MNSNLAFSFKAFNSISVWQIKKNQRQYKNSFIQKTNGIWADSFKLILYSFILYFAYFSIVCVLSK